jgi:Bacterial transcriptional activator domain/Transposase
MSAVVSGIDPHKASHTAVAVDERELALGDVRVRATAVQGERLLAWAAQWPQRSWAIENAAGLGYLPAQQLVSAGERVVDVQPKLAARVRLQASAASSKSDRMTPVRWRSSRCARRRRKRPQLVLDVLWQATAVGPLHEPLHAELVANLALAGQRSEALAAFHAVRGRLESELGIDPSPALKLAYHQIGVTKYPLPSKDPSADDTRRQRSARLLARVDRAKRRPHGRPGRRPIA